MSRRPRRMTAHRPGGFRLALLVCLGAVSAGADETESIEPPPASAEPSDGDARVVELNERGSNLYAGGDYRRAVELFLQAYAVDGDPNLLFNIAACYEGLGDREGAIEKYRAFLADPNADPEGRPRAEGAITRLLTHEDAAPPQTPLEGLVAPAATAAAVPPASPPAADLAPSSAAPEWLPWAVLGGGAALGVAGVSLYLLGAADHREVTDASGYDDPNAVVRWRRERAEALVESGDTKKVVGVTTAAVGGAVVLGYVLWRAFETSDEPGNGPRMGLAVSPSAASVAWSGQF